MKTQINWFLTILAISVSTTSFAECTDNTDVLEKPDLNSSSLSAPTSAGQETGSQSGTLKTGATTSTEAPIEPAK